MRLHEPDGHECRSAASSGPSPEARRLPDRRGHGPRRSRAAGRRHRNPARPEPDMRLGLRTSSAYRFHPGLRPWTRACPYRSRNGFSTLLAPAAVPTTDASTGNAAPVSQGMTSGELAASLRQIDGQAKGKHPPDFHFRSKPSCTSATVPAGPTPTSGPAGTSSRSPHQRRSHERFCWSRWRRTSPQSSRPDSGSAGRGERTDRTKASMCGLLRRVATLRDRDRWRCPPGSASLTTADRRSPALRRATRQTAPGYPCGSGVQAGIPTRLIISLHTQLTQRRWPRSAPWRSANLR